MHKASTRDLTDIVAARPLTALLSQILVAFTVELDNEFECRMRHAGCPGAPLSLQVWSNLIRFLVAGPVRVDELATSALAPVTQVKSELGCLERWRYVALLADPSDERPIPQAVHHRAARLLRDGFGSGRGIRSGWLVRLSEKGRTAAGIWPALLSDIEQRWSVRFGAVQLAELCRALADVVEQFELELPEALPGLGTSESAYPERRAGEVASRALPVLLSRALLAFAIEFDRDSRVPLWLCANTLRVLGETPTPVSEIPRLTGASPETSGIGWQMKPYLVVEPDPSAKRGKVARLTPRGLIAQKNYSELTRQIEQRWQTRFGAAKIQHVRESLAGLLTARNGNGVLLLSLGLIPAEGTIRAGTPAPALGRPDVGVAAKKRMRDLTAQTSLFVQDPVNALPHFPLWDMNRGFGP